MHTPEQNQPITFPNGAAVYTRGPVDAYAWPGGYPLAYYPVDEHGSTVGDVLCPDCATKELADPETTMHDGTAGYLANIEEEVHDTIWCDGCSRPFIFQNWCDFCRESVDVDEDHPHTCRPLKWSASVQWPSGRPDIRRFAAREQARDLKRSYERSYLGRDGVRVTVSKIDPPIMPGEWY